MEFLRTRVIPVYLLELDTILALTFNCHIVSHIERLGKKSNFYYVLFSLTVA